MFGPDKCGEDYKLHFIFRHKHPKTGVFEEKHAKPPFAFQQETQSISVQADFSFFGPAASFPVRLCRGCTRR